MRKHTKEQTRIPLVVREGDTIIYNDGRAGHVNVAASVLRAEGQRILVQFEDRADTTTINLSDREWCDHLSIRGTI